MYGKVKIQNFTNYYYNRFLTREQVKFQDEYNFLHTGRFEQMFDAGTR